jgi:predicted AAA+ superfamily ATPase
MMIKRNLEETLVKALQNMPVVVLLGARQVGKTTLALSIRRDRRKVLTRPIFNGYMFIRTLLNPECHLEILKTVF